MRWSKYFQSNSPYRFNYVPLLFGTISKNRMLHHIYTAQNKYDYMSLNAIFCYTDLYIIEYHGILLKKIQFPVQRGANREATTIVGDTAAR